MDDIRVAVIDDSPVMRRFLSEAIGAAAGLQVVSVSHNATGAWLELESSKPDVLTLDVDMPDTDGISFLEELMRKRPVPVVMVSGLTQSGSSTALRALQAGAVDFVCKPSGGTGSITDAWVVELVARLKRAAMIRPRRFSGNPSDTRPRSGEFRMDRVLTARRCTADVIAIGCDSAGIQSLRYLLSVLPRDSPPVVVVQRVSRCVGQAFITAAKGECVVGLKSAQDGDALVRGQVLLGYEETELSLDRSGARTCVRLRSIACGTTWPSGLDTFFTSCAKSAGRSAYGILLDSASKDGSVGLSAIGIKGGMAILQVPDRERDAGSGKSSCASGLHCARIESMPLERIPVTLFGDRNSP